MKMCVKCKETLSLSQILYSHGRCPECGYKGQSAGSIVDVQDTVQGHFISVGVLVVIIGIIWALFIR